MPYIYRISRRNQAKPEVTVKTLPATGSVEVVPEPEASEPSYRDLQAQAKALDIPANQTAEELKEAIAEKQGG